MPELVMPKMGDSMEEGTILRWLKSEGEPVAEEEIVAEIQTEKATIEIPTSDAGVLSQILVQAGTTVPVGTVIAVILRPGEQPSSRTAAAASPAPAASAPEANGAAPVEAPVVTSETDYSLTSSGGGRLKASPLARKWAAQWGVELTGVQGTGPGGRIVGADVEEARRSSPSDAPLRIAVDVPRAPGSDRPMSPIRKVIARRLLQSKQTIPHFYLTIDVDMREAARVRAAFNAAAEDRKVSFNDLVVRACAIGLEKHPAVNSQLSEPESIRTPDGIHIGVAVALPDGLVVPVIRNTNQKSLTAIAAETRELAGRARKGGLKTEEYSGGTFTVSNLGMYDIAQFQAIINPPEAAILAVGAIRDTPIVENGQLAVGKQMFLTISADHRLADGSVAAQFLQEVKRLLENPLALFS